MMSWGVIIYDHTETGTLKMEVNEVEVIGDKGKILRQAEMDLPRDWFRELDDGPEDSEFGLMIKAIPLALMALHNRVCGCGRLIGGLQPLDVRADGTPVFPEWGAIQP
jgi:hypothetical protein